MFYVFCFLFIDLFPSQNASGLYVFHNICAPHMYTDVHICISLYLESIILTPSTLISPLLFLSLLCAYLSLPPSLSMVWPAAGKRFMEQQRIRAERAQQAADLSTAPSEADSLGFSSVRVLVLYVRWCCACMREGKRY